MSSNDEKNEVFEIYRRFPLLVPNEKCDKWEGFLLTEHERYQVVLKTPNYPSLENVKLFCSSVKAEEVNFLEDKTDGSLVNYLNCLDNYLKSKSVNASSCVNLSNVKYLNTFALIIKEIETHIDRENVVEIDSSLKWIKLKYYNHLSDETHFVKVILDSKYPSTPLQVADADLPDVVVTQLQEVYTLGSFYSKFKEIIISLSDFWIVCDQLSKDAWIIEPEDPKKRDVHRRVVISDNLSIHLLFNPLTPYSMPDVKFLGSINSVSQARIVYQKNLSEMGWSEEESVVANLMRLLNVDCLPTKPTDGDSSDEVVCIICYTSALDHEPSPSKWCSNANCTGWFHHSCLLEWLNSVPTSKTAFDHILGPCPHCDEKLFCPITLP